MAILGYWKVDFFYWPSPTTDDVAAFVCPTLPTDGATSVIHQRNNAPNFFLFSVKCRSADESEQVKMISAATEAETNALFKGSQRSGDESTRNRPEMNESSTPQLDLADARASAATERASTPPQLTHRRMIRSDQ